jgi:hypothetical protein
MFFRTAMSRHPPIVRKDDHTIRGPMDQGSEGLTIQRPVTEEMAPLCKVEVTLPRVLGFRGMRRGGGVDEQAGVQPA